MSGIVPTEECITKEELQKAFPSKAKAITDEIVDIFNKSRTEVEFQGESLLRNAVTFQSVMEGNSASITEYINAIRFCAYLISMDDNYTQAYIRTFYTRDFVKSRVDAPTGSADYKLLVAAASRYRKTKLVVDILTVSQVPLELMFTGARYKAVGVLANLMETARSDRDKINAAKELLAATKGPENVKLELDVGVKESTALDQLNTQLAAMAARQTTLLESGASNLEEFGSMKVKDEDVIEGEVE